MKQLLDAKEFLRQMFPDACRPSLRWLRDRQKDKSIPFIRIGSKIFFDPDAVMAALEKKTINPK